MKKSFLVFSVIIISASFLLILFLATGLWERFLKPKQTEYEGAILITPGNAESTPVPGQLNGTLRNENLNTKIPMESGETVIAVLNRETENSILEEQFAVYYTGASPYRKIFITHISYDDREGQYRRLWNEPVLATRIESIILFSHDLIGDRNDCIIVTGMNSENEHTMTVFRYRPSLAVNYPYDKILEIQIDGSIVIQETVRSIAYGQGITTGTSFNIAAYGHDALSSNLLDQIETIYAYNPVTGVYEQSAVTRIPGSQIEQRRIRELLSGAPGVFQNFIHDLWYYISPEGTVESGQYIYFDPAGKEIIFFGDEAQQIFSWLSSTNTRYGMQIRSQNISITTLLRFIDIELESLESIRLRVREDVRLRIEAGTTWDGSYRRASAAIQHDTVPSVKPGINARYESTWGRIHFRASGEYTITTAGGSENERRGNYVFFTVNGNELLEMRPEEGITSENRMVYKLESIGSGYSLSRVRLGINGIQDLYEPPVILTLVE